MSNQLLFINTEDAFTSKSFEVMFAEGIFAESSNNLRVLQPDQTNASITLEVQGNIIADKFRGRSDERLKTNVRDLASGLTTIKQIVGKAYNLNHETETSYGFIAQDVQKVVPSIVKDEGNLLSISYFELLPFIVESIKELDRRLENIETMLNSSSDKKT